MLTQTIENAKESLFIVTVALIVSGIGTLGGLLFSRYLENRSFHKPVPHAQKPAVEADEVKEATSLYNSKAVFAVSEEFEDLQYPIL